MKKETSELFKKLALAVNDFPVSTVYWDHSPLRPGENPKRNRPAPWIKKTVELVKIIGGNTVVEIGSTRMQISRNCIEYYDNCFNMTPEESPACCQDGHSTYFWAREGFEVHTVDIDPNCKDRMESCYRMKESDPEWRDEFPSNLHIHTQDGIQFLKDFNKPIDLLFLDGWDVGHGRCAESHLEAFQAAEDKLAEYHIVSVDDTDFNTHHGGKDKLLTPYLINNGYVRLLYGRQIIFFKYC